MPDSETHGEIPSDLQGALELAKANGDTLAAEVYAEAIAGKVPVEDVAGIILALEEGGPRTYPDSITSPASPPSTSGTDVTRTA